MKVRNVPKGGENESAGSYGRAKSLNILVRGNKCKCRETGREHGHLER